MTSSSACSPASLGPGRFLLDTRPAGAEISRRLSGSCVAPAEDALLLGVSQATGERAPIARAAVESGHTTVKTAAKAVSLPTPPSDASWCNGAKASPSGILSAQRATRSAALDAWHLGHPERRRCGSCANLPAYAWHAQFARARKRPRAAARGRVWCERRFPVAASPLSACAACHARAGEVRPAPAWPAAPGRPGPR